MVFNYGCLKQWCLYHHLCWQQHVNTRCFTAHLAALPDPRWPSAPALSGAHAHGASTGRCARSTWELLAESMECLRLLGILCPVCIFTHVCMYVRMHACTHGGFVRICKHYVFLCFSSVFLLNQVAWATNSTRNDRSDDICCLDVQLTIAVPMSMLSRGGTSQWKHFRNKIYKGQHNMLWNFYPLPPRFMRCLAWKAKLLIDWLVVFLNLDGLGSQICILRQASKSWELANQWQ